MERNGALVERLIICSFFLFAILVFVITQKEGRRSSAGRLINN
jgi:hypothetical protein